MMCFAQHFAPIGDHARRKVRPIPLMYFVIYSLEINRSYLMKEILVVNNNLVCLREKESRITRIEDVSIVLSHNRNVLAIKLN